MFFCDILPRTLGGPMKRWPELATFIGIGWYIAICIVLGVGVGLWLDGVAGTQVLFTLLGLFLGLILAFYGVYRMVQSLLDSGKKGDGG